MEGIIGKGWNQQHQAGSHQQRQSLLSGRDGNPCLGGQFPVIYIGGRPGRHRPQKIQKGQLIHIHLIYGNNSGAYWISPINIGGRYL